MTDNATGPGRQGPAFFDIAELASALPAPVGAYVRDHRLIDTLQAGARLFRLAGALPRHRHNKSDEYLLVVSGRARFTVADEPEAEIGPGNLVFFPRATWHGFPAILEHPFMVLAFEAPARDPLDVEYAEPNAATFIQR